MCNNSQWGLLAIFIISRLLCSCSRSQPPLLTKDLDFSNTQTKILFLDDELPNIEKQGITISSLATAYQAGTTRFYSAIKGYGGYLPTEKLLTFFQAQHLPTGMNLLAFESAYNEALHQITDNK